MHKLFNFDNIGGKIKSFAKLSCWITILLIWFASLIAFFILVVDEWTIEYCWIPIVSAVGGPLIIWVCGWVMYAFGELVEDTHAIRTKYYPQEEEFENREIDRKAKLQAQVEARNMAKKAKTEAKIKSQKYECPKCKHTIHYGDDICKKCGRKLDWSKVQEQIK